MAMEEQDTRFYNSKYDSLESTVSSFSAIKNKAISWMFVWCKSDIRKTITNAPDNHIIRLQHKEQPVFSMEISRVDEDTTIKEIHALCIPSDIQSLFMIASDAKYSTFRDFMNRIIKYNYPLLSHVFLKDSEIKQLFFEMNKQNRVMIMVYKISYYSRIRGVRHQKNLAWAIRPYDEVFDDLRDQDGWIKRIDFYAPIQKMEKNVSRWIKLFDGSISRNCYFKINIGFNEFYESIIKRSIGMIGERLGYLQKRSENAKNVRPEPIVIQFNEPIFKDEGWNEKFIENMEQLKNVSITELHKNPYVHLSVLDYLDGSSYGIWIVSDNEINIIPQARATVASMTRLLNHIYENVEEGETTVYAPVKVE